MTIQKHPRASRKPAKSYLLLLLLPSYCPTPSRSSAQPSNVSHAPFSITEAVCTHIIEFIDILEYVAGSREDEEGRGDCCSIFGFSQALVRRPCRSRKWTEMRPCASEASEHSACSYSNCQQKTLDRGVYFLPSCLWVAVCCRK